MIPSVTTPGMVMPMPLQACGDVGVVADRVSEQFYEDVLGGFRAMRSVGRGGRAADLRSGEVHDDRGGELVSQVETREVGAGAGQGQADGGPAGATVRCGRLGEFVNQSLLDEGSGDDCDRGSLQAEHRRELYASEGALLAQRIEDASLVDVPQRCARGHERPPLTIEIE